MSFWERFYMLHERKLNLGVSNQYKFTKQLDLVFIILIASVHVFICTKATFFLHAPPFPSISDILRKKNHHYTSSHPYDSFAFIVTHKSYVTNPHSFVWLLFFLRTLNSLYILKKITYPFLYAPVPWIFSCVHLSSLCFSRGTCIWISIA